MRRARAPLTAAAAALAAVAGACGGGLEEVQGDPTAGERLVADELVEPSCGRCHTLEAAGLVGDVAPDLDDLRPGYRRVLDAIRRGPGAMPSYGHLSDEEQHDIAAYVSRATAQDQGGDDEQERPDDG